MKKVMSRQYVYINHILYKLYTNYDYSHGKEYYTIELLDANNVNLNGWSKDKYGRWLKDIKKEEIEYAFNCRTYCMFNGIRCWVNSELDDGKVWLMALIDIRNKEEVEKVLKLGFKKDETGDPRDPGTYSGAFNKDDLSEFIYEKKAIPGLPFKEE